MLIENTGVGVIAFGIQGPKLKNNKTGQSTAMTALKPVMAIPGVNHIEEKVWAELEKNPSVVKFIEDGRLVLHGGPSAAEKKKAKAELPPTTILHDDFLGMSEEIVIKLVKKTLFLPLLHRWEDGENRPKVIRAIHGQVDKCGPTAVKKDD